MTAAERTIKIMDTHTLKRLNAHAVRKGFNRSLSAAGIRALDPDGFHVVIFSMIHNDDHVRTRLLVKMDKSNEPVPVFLDMEFKDYNALPSATYTRQEAS